MNIVFIADFFADQILGGGELNNEELINILSSEGHSVEKINSHAITNEFVEQKSDHKFIIANFVNLPHGTKELFYDKQYIIYEHDHKYLSTRNPGVFPNFKAPSEHVVNLEFYQNAKAVLCQSVFHTEIAHKNTKRSSRRIIYSDFCNGLPRANQLSPTSHSANLFSSLESWICLVKSKSVSSWSNILTLPSSLCLNLVSIDSV